MSPEATEKRKEYMRNYMRKWRAKNKEKAQAIESRKWENAASNSGDLKEFRCRICNRLMFKGQFKGMVQHKCKCGTYNDLKENNLEALEAL